MKKIKIFESYLELNYEKEIINSIYEKLEERYNFLHENEEDYEEKILTRGEKAAMSRDYQIISRSQMAALYLKALGRVEGEDGAYLVMIDGINDFGSFDPGTRAFNITNAGLADAIGLESISTVTRTVNKFVNLIEGTGETPSEAIYPKIVEAYRIFLTMNPVQISNIASESIQDPTEYTLNREKEALSRETSSANRIEKQKKEQALGEKIYSFINSLKRESQIFREPGKAQKAAIKKISSETGEDEMKLKEYYKRFLISRKMLNPLNFYEK